MAEFILSPSMSLPIPIVGQDMGPDYAFNINNSLTILDGHDHASGYGVQINPSGLNINADLTFNGNNAITLRTVRFQSQVSTPVAPNDLGCLCEIGVDLYYIDGSGNVVRITQSGGVAGSPGSISNLTSPASASYVSANSTFVFQSAANIAANLDGGSVLLRNITPNSTFAITLSPPAALASNYTITLPTLPSVTSVATINTSGGIGSQTYDQVGQHMTSTGANSIASVVTRPVSSGSVGELGVLFSIPCSSFNTTSSSYVAITNLSGNITTNGRPIVIGIAPLTGGSIGAGITNAASSTETISAQIGLFRDGTLISEMPIVVQIGQGPALFTSMNVQVPPGSFGMVDSESAGTYNFSYSMKVNNAGTTGFVTNVFMFAYEL